MDQSPVKNCDGIIADGSIRAGKTVSFGVGYTLWLMSNYNEQNFIMAGKTINSLRRNMWTDLKRILISRGYSIKENRDENKVTLQYGGHKNYIYFFGGRDERSQDLVQGITAAGALFDEVALMPESFVNQATGRCSVEGSRFWFNCNPDNPSHWFKVNWIDKAPEKNLFFLHFTMDDNPSLSENTKRRYRSLYVGVFYKRFIEGLWVAAEGAVYSMFSDDNICEHIAGVQEDQYEKYISIDYGTTNAFAALKVLDDGNEVIYNDEFYFDSRKNGFQKTDEQYIADLEKWLGPDIDNVIQFIVDPSAASFIAALRYHGYRVRPAENEVLEGIRKTSTLIDKKKVKVSNTCENLIREINGYSWDDASLKGKEKPLKIADHAVDAMRYYVETRVNLRRIL